MVCKLFKMAHSMKACIIFFMGWARFDDGAGGDNEVQRTMLELINQLYGDYLSCLWHYTDLICLIPCY
jgi:26S proteasome regulatory subunit T1